MRMQVSVGLEVSRYWTEAVYQVLRNEMCVCVCVMGQVVGMDEQTVRWSSLTGSVSLCSEMILRMSC